MTTVFLSGPASLPSLLGHSTYLFGTSAILLCAAIDGPLSTLFAALLVIARALFIDAQAGIDEREQLARAAFFVTTAGVIAYWANALRRYRRQSTEAIAELAGREAVLRSILDTGPDALLMIDSTGVVSSYGAAAEQLFGWTAEDVIGRNVGMLMPVPYSAEQDGHIAHYLQSGDRQIIGKSREVTGLRKNGTQFPMMLRVGEVRLGDERQFTGFVHDLTSLHAANDRAQDLSDQLSHVWRMNSLGEMAAILAHELNQPLTAISNYVRGARTMVARLELKDDSLLDAVDKAGDQALRAGEIIRRMRALIARNDVEQSPESVAEMISEMDFIITLVAREANVQVTYNLSEGPDQVLADRIQIQQVVANLVRNAVEAMRDSPQRKLEVSTHRRDGGWLICIEDSGPGVPKEVEDRIFMPLTSSKEKGMGLGLSISKNIVENHKGELWVERSHLGGAAFYFVLPSVVVNNGKGGGDSGSNGLRSG